MYPPVGVDWLGGWFDRVVEQQLFYVLTQSSTCSVLVCRLGVMLMDVDFLPMAKPLSS